MFCWKRSATLNRDLVQSRNFERAVSGSESPFLAPPRQNQRAQSGGECFAPHEEKRRPQGPRSGRSSGSEKVEKSPKTVPESQNSGKPKTAPRAFLNPQNFFWMLPERIRIVPGMILVVSGNLRNVPKIDQNLSKFDLAVDGFGDRQEKGE